MKISIAAANLLNPLRDLEGDQQPDFVTLIPYFVALALAVELHLKTLAFVCGMSHSQIRSHSHDYYRLLRRAVRIGHLSNTPSIRDFHVEPLEPFLQGISAQFTALRYAYEKDWSQLPMDAQSSRVVLTGLRAALRVARPDWPNLHQHSSVV